MIFPYVSSFCQDYNPIVCTELLVLAWLSNDSHTEQYESSWHITKMFIWKIHREYHFKVCLNVFSDSSEATLGASKS